MPCREITDRRGKRTGFICFRNEPVSIKHFNRVYRFEWTASSGWVPVNKDGSGRLTLVPDVIWNELKKRYPKWTDEKEAARDGE